MCLLLVSIYDPLLVSVVKNSLNLLIFPVYLQGFSYISATAGVQASFLPWISAITSLTALTPRPKLTRKAARVFLHPPQFWLQCPFIKLLVVPHHPHGPFQAFSLPIQHFSSCGLFCVLPHLTFCPLLVTMGMVCADVATSLFSQQMKRFLKTRAIFYSSSCSHLLV